MVIQDMTRNAIVASLNKYLNEVEEKREAERIKLIKYYEHNSTDIYVKEYFKGTSLAQIPVFTQSLTKRVVNQRALVYKKNPTVAADEKYLDLTQGLDKQRRQLEKLTFLLGTMCFRSKVITDELTQSDRLAYDPIPLFKPYFLPGESEPFGVSYPLYNYGGARDGQTAHAVWTKTYNGKQGEHFIYYDNKAIPAKKPNGEENSEMINPYDILPFTFTHREPQIAGDFWVEGATDIVKANHQLDIGMTELALAYRFDAVGIKWIKGVDDVADEMPSGTDKFIIIPHEADIGRLGSASLDQLIETLKYMTEVPLHNNFLVVKWADKGQAKSGIALTIENLDNLEQREASVLDTWRSWEDKRFKVDQRLLDVHGIKVSDEYYVNFAEPTPPMSKEEERDQWDWELDRGFATAEDYFRWKNPDMSEDELAAKMEKYTAAKAEEKQNNFIEALKTPAQ